MFDVGRVGWMFILRGVFALLLGLVVLSNPGLSLMALVFAFGLYAISDGVYTLGSAFRHSDEGERPWMALFVSGFTSVFAGWIALFTFHFTAEGLVCLIAAWAVINGGMEILGATYLRKHLAEESMLGAGGVISLLFGLAISLLASRGVASLGAWIGAFALLYGVVLIAFGMKLRTWMKPGMAEFQHRISHGVAHYCLSDDPT